LFPCFGPLKKTDGCTWLNYTVPIFGQGFWTFKKKKQRDEEKDELFCWLPFCAIEFSHFIVLDLIYHGCMFFFFLITGMILVLVKVLQLSLHLALLIGA